MLRRIQAYASFVRFSHSVFALPFALAGMVLASRYTQVTLSRVGWVIVAMVAARTAAMGFNRLVDARHDALNPRTEAREIPRGVISRFQAVMFVMCWSSIFVAVTSQISVLCLALSPVALAIAFWYSLAKRYTNYSQLFLGLAMAGARAGNHGCSVWRSGCGSGASTCCMHAKMLNLIGTRACDPFQFDTGCRNRCGSLAACTW